MKYLIIIVAICSCSFVSFAQKSNAFVELEQLKQKYENCESLKLTFRFSTQYPNEARSTQDGLFLKHANDFLLHLEDYTWIANSEDIYFVNSEAKEISISSLTEDDDILTPTSVLEKLSGDNFDFLSIGEGKAIMIPESEEDYEKIELGYSLKTMSLERVKIYNTDGSIFEYRVMEEECPADFEASLLKFDVEKYSDYFIEDLRD